MFTIDEIVRATQGRLIHGPLKGKVTGVAIDSRHVSKGQVFIAVKGDIFDGHEFINDVITNGVRLLIVHRRVKVNHPGVSVIEVNDTTRALGDIARFHRLRSQVPVIAITGSAGKTTTKEMIAAVLSRRYNVLKNEGTQNNHIGVPMTLLKLKSSHEVVILECGTNQPGDIPWLADVAHPNVVVFTNIGESHLEKLKTPAGVLKEKWSLVGRMQPKGTVIINADDVYLARQLRACGKTTAITYSMKRLSHVRATQARVMLGRFLSFRVKGKTFELNTCGVNNVYNALAAYACGVLFKVSRVNIHTALKAFEFPKGRGQLVPLGKGWLVNDAYNANPVSVRLAVDTLQEVATQGKRILVLADMLELGDKTKALHAKVGVIIAKSRTDVLITVGRLARLIGQAAAKQNKRMRVFTCQDIESAQRHLGQVFVNGDAVLVKGSRRMAMERVVEFLLTSPKGAI